MLQQSASGLGIDQNLQRHRAVSLRQHGFLVVLVTVQYRCDCGLFIRFPVVLCLIAEENWITNTSCSISSTVGTQAGLVLSTGQVRLPSTACSGFEIGDIGHNDTDVHCIRFICMKNMSILQPPAVVAWLSGSALVSINEVTLRRARLVLGWVTVFGRVRHLGV